MEVKRLTGVLGAVVEGVNLREASDGVLRAIEQVFARYLVLYFPEQSFDRFQLRELSGRFGTTFVHPFERKQFADCPGVLEVRRDPGEAKDIFGGGGWHADYTWNDKPGYASFLHGQVVPDVGGDTCFVSTIAAFASLSPPMQSLLRSLRAVHLYHGYDGQIDAQYTATHPVVLTHPITGAEGLFINSMFVTHFEGMTVEESQPILRFLYRRIEEYRFSCRIRWQQGGLLMWDNRFTLHLPIHDNHDELRLMIWSSCVDRRLETSAQAAG